LTFAPYVTEVAMRVTVSLGLGREFTRRSKTDSICMLCFLTVRADRHTLLEQAEQNHTAICQPLRLTSDLARAS